MLTKSSSNSNIDSCRCHYSPNFSKNFTHYIFLITFVFHKPCKSTHSITACECVETFGNLSSLTSTTEVYDKFHDCFTLLILTILAFLFPVLKGIFTNMFSEIINNNKKTCASGLLMIKFS